MCWGGYSLQRAHVLGAADASRCNVACGGASGTVCGGSMANSVYEFTQCAGG